MMVTRFKRRILRGLRLGESTLVPANPGQVKQAAGVFGLLEPGSDQLSLLDVTPVNRTRNFHNFSLETPEFFDDLNWRSTGADIPKSRKLYALQTHARLAFLRVDTGALKTA